MLFTGLLGGDLGSLYEEDISNPGSSNPYTVYYSFGGKLVGMRMANQLNPAENGQYRIAGDNLGSTTLVVDSADTPQVVQRTYYKPYGEEAYLGGSRQTSVGYTGQRLDTDTSLMYYGARFYDPALSYFLSADTIAPNVADPRTRERYSYVMNNPLRYSDSTGHCADDKETTCADAKATLARYGFHVNLEEWDQVQDLRWMIEAIQYILQQFGHSSYDYNFFKSVMGIGAQLVTIYNVDKTRSQDYAGIGGLANRAKCIKGFMCTEQDGEFMGVSPDGTSEGYKAGGNGTYEQFFKYMFTHELGHLMDNRHSHYYSQRLQHFIEEPCRLIFTCHEPAPSTTGQLNDREDWAETFAETLYPGYIPDAAHGSSAHDLSSERHRRYGTCVVYGCPPPVLALPPRLIPGYP